MPSPWVGDSRSREVGLNRVGPVWVGAEACAEEASGVLDPSMACMADAALLTAAWVIWHLWACAHCNSATGKLRPQEGSAEQSGGLTAVSSQATRAACLSAAG